ncbi:MAG: MFS transporter [Thermodesulfovibrio sp.]|nr:MFS transporter [Thermodesulfovibrio sp.]
MSHPLKIKEFRAYWIGQTISLSGTWMQHIAQNWLVYILTKSALYLGLVSFLSSVPMLLFTLFGGVLADKYSRKKILIFTQIFSLFPALFLGIVIQINIVTIWHVAMASFILGIATAFDMPARQAFISEIVSREMITKAVAMQSMSFNIARIIGPFLAGLIVANLNFQMCFYLNALSFMPLIIILITLCTKSCINFDGDMSFKSFFKEGLHFLVNNKRILYIICAIGTFTIFGISFIPILPIIADSVLNAGIEGLGMIVSSIGFGSLTAAIIITLKKDIDDKANHIFKASMIFPIGILGIAFSTNLYVSMAFAFLLGFAFVNFFTVSNSFIQNQTDQRLRGRIMSFFSFVFLGFTPIGNILVGFLVEAFGVRNVLIAYSFICFLAGFFFLKFLFNRLS